MATSKAKLADDERTYVQNLVDASDSLDTKKIEQNITDVMGPDYAQKYKDSLPTMANESHAKRVQKYATDPRMDMVQTPEDLVIFFPSESADPNKRPVLEQSLQFKKRQRNMEGAKSVAEMTKGLPPE